MYEFLKECEIFKIGSTYNVLIKKSILNKEKYYAKQQVIHKIPIGNINDSISFDLSDYFNSKLFTTLIPKILKKLLNGNKFERLLATNILLNKMEKLEQIKAQIKELYETLDSKDSEFMSSTSSYEEYERKRDPYMSKINKLNRELRLIMDFEYKGDIKNGHIMQLKDFIISCKNKEFIDYDGFGYYVKDNKSTNIKIYPSDIQYNSIRKDFDMIVWYNK